MARILLELDGRCYSSDGEDWLPVDIDWVSPPVPFPVDYVVSDLGSQPRFRIACGRKAYCEYVLAKDLRDDGELAGHGVLVVDAMYQPSRQSCGILFHVVDGQQHALRLEAVERATRSAVLVSFGKVYAELLRTERCSACAYVVFHHDVIDVLISRGGEAQAVQRVYDAGALGSGRAAPLAQRLNDVIDALQRQSKTTIDRVVCHHLAIDVGGLPALEEVVTALARPGRPPARLAAMKPFRIGQRQVLGSLNRVLRAVDAFAACSSRQSKWRRWAIEKMPLVAGVLLVANLASVGWMRHVDAATVAVEAEIAAHPAPEEFVAPELPEIEALLPVATAIDQAVRLPTVEAALADISVAGRDVEAMTIKSLELLYPAAQPKRRRGTDSDASAALVVRIAGRIDAPAVDAVARYDSLVARLGEAGYRVRNGEVNTASKTAIFNCTVERLANE